MIRKFRLLAMIMALFIVLILAAFPFTTQAQTSDWDYIKISPETGHWNYPGYFVLEAQRSVTVSWEVKCTHGGCDREDEWTYDYTFAEGERKLVGWGHQCYRWQFDPVGRAGFIAEAEPELCAVPTSTPTQTATQAPPTETPTATPTATATQAPATETPTATPTSTATEVPATETPTPSPTVAATQDPATETPTPSPTVPATQDPATETPTPSPTVPATQNPTPETPTATPASTLAAPTLTLTPSSTFTPTATPVTPTTPPDPDPTNTPAAPPNSGPTNTPVAPPSSGPANTPAAPSGPAPTSTPLGFPGLIATEEVILPATGVGPPAPLFASPLWPALAALMMLALAGNMVWGGILQAENMPISTNLYPALRSQAKKALLLILLSLLILAFMVLPPIMRQAALDFWELSAFSPPPPALVQELPQNSLFAPVEQAPALDDQQAQSALPISPGERNTGGEAPAILASAGVNLAEDWPDTGPVTRLVIPALEVDSQAYFVPFENKTWDIQELGKNIAWLGNTSTPGMGSNTVLAGHYTVERSGNGPFRYLKNLKPGDLIQVYTTENVYTYSVREQAVVMPNDASVLGQTGQSQLTLLTCTEWDEQAWQYVSRRAVYADLVSVSPASSD